jgi:hypothetical protein
MALSNAEKQAAWRARRQQREKALDKLLRAAIAVRDGAELKRLDPAIRCAERTITGTKPKRK